MRICQFAQQRFINDFQFGQRIQKMQILCLFCYGNNNKNIWQIAFKIFFIFGTKLRRQNTLVNWMDCQSFKLVRANFHAHSCAPFLDNLKQSLWFQLLICLMLGEQRKMFSSKKSQPFKLSHLNNLGCLCLEVVKSETIKIDKKILWRSICRHANESAHGVATGSSFYYSRLHKTRGTFPLFYTILSSRICSEITQFFKIEWVYNFQKCITKI